MNLVENTAAVFSALKDKEVALAAQEILNPIDVYERNVLALPLHVERLSVGNHTVHIDELENEDDHEQ